MQSHTEKVLQRLVHEKLILATQIKPAAKKITLEEFLKAAEEEPRIYSALGAILLYRPKIFRNLDADLKRNPEIMRFVETLFLDKNPKAKLYGHDKAFYEKVARNYREFLQQKKSAQGRRTEVLSLRLTPEEIETLQAMTEKLKTRNLGDTIRTLIHRQMKS